ncbi:hypothetical protein PJN28_23585 [Mycobacterium kansasii]
MTAETLTGTEDEALIQALRNLWSILGATGRRQAINTANGIKEQRDDQGD